MTGLEIVQTPWGPVSIGEDADGVCTVHFGVLGAPFGTLKTDAAQQLLSYAAHARTAFSVPLSMAGVSAFARSCYRAAMQIPYGQTRTYGQLALMMGRPRAARAVGSAMRHCTLMPFVPCHRVISAHGAIKGGGVQMRTAPLSHEEKNR